MPNVVAAVSTSLATASSSSGSGVPATPGSCVWVWGGSFEPVLHPSRRGFRNDVQSHSCASLGGPPRAESGGTDAQPALRVVEMDRRRHRPHPQTRLGSRPRRTSSELLHDTKADDAEEAAAVAANIFFSVSEDDDDNVGHVGA